jgi:hypothetical protein
MGKHQAPVLAAELEDFLTKSGYSIRTTPGNPPVAVLPGGEVRLPSITKRKTELTHDVIRRVARNLSMTSTELLAAIGRRPVDGGKPKNEPPSPSTVATSKASVLSAAVALRATVGNIEHWLRHGIHGGDIYGRVADAIAVATQTLKDLPPRVDAATEREIYARLAPDDAKYRPSRVDPLKKGAARVTGLTAKAAENRTTFTKYRHDEMDAR